MLRTWIGLLMALLLTGPVLAQDESLEGEWVVVQASAYTAQRASIFLGAKYIFRGNKLLVTTNDNKQSRMLTIKLDVTKSPRHIDFIFDQQGKPLLGIYEIRSDTHLYLCWSTVDGADRPPSFNLPGRKHEWILLVLERPEWQIAPRKLKLTDEQLQQRDEATLKRLQGRWTILDCVSDDASRDNVLKGCTIIIEGNTLKLVAPMEKTPAELTFRIEVEYSPLRIHTREFCGIFDFDKQGNLRIAVHRSDRFDENLVPPRLIPPIDHDQIQKRQLYMLLQRADNK